MKYMPTSDDEWQSISAKYQGDDDSEYPWESYIEKVILARIAEQGLVIVPKVMELEYAKAVCQVNGIATSVPLVTYDKRNTKESKP